MNVRFRSDPSAGNIVTFAQFVCIALEGLYVHLDWGAGAGGQARGHRLIGGGGSSSDKAGWLPRLQERVIPLSHYVAMVTIFFTVSTLNNAALGYQIALPLHMVFRSGSLIATALIGRLIFKEVYALLLLLLLLRFHLPVQVGPDVSWVRGCV
jgi:UDP-xylose/UDP-N-acetylglucosamine transporter B4